jgi:hypothetical protein
MVTIEDGTQEFDKVLLELFDATEGAYSVVTGAESDKGHITTAGAEDKIIRNFFGEENLHVGAKKLDPENATKTFYLYKYESTPVISYLTVNCPKPAKSELHIYMQKAQGFRPEEGDVWFVFKKKDDDKLTLGSMSQREWALFKQSSITENEQEEEMQDIAYQDIINRPVSPKACKISSSFKYPRNPTIAKDCMNRVDYECEINGEHETFTSRATGLPYVEVHHLVPLSFQRDFDVSLDVHANIVVLCPNCHRVMHHAEMDACVPILEQLFAEKHNGLKEAGIEITFDALISLYGLPNA